MNKEKQFQAIAKLHGWSNLYQLEGRDVFMGWWSGEPKISLVIPDYLNSRDEVAKVLEHLKNSKEYPHFQEDYVNHLRMVVEKSVFSKSKTRHHGVDWFEVLCATAEKQCEAILWATGKYKHE